MKEAADDDLAERQRASEASQSASQPERERGHEAEEKEKRRQMLSRASRVKVNQTEPVAFTLHAS